jgi:hypothetical protein
MKRTTILADEALLQEARYLAQSEGKSLTTVVREALAEYVAAHRKPRRVIPFAGIGRSGDPKLTEKIDDIIRAGLDPIEGFSPRRYRESVQRSQPASEKTSADPD